MDRARPDKMQEEGRSGFRLSSHAACQALDGLARDLVRRGVMTGQGARPVQVRNGESLYRVGDRTDHFYLVQTGRIRASLESEAGRELVVADAGPGETVGELCFCAVHERQENAVAVTNATVIGVYGEDLIRYVQGGRDAAEEVLEYLFHQIGSLTTRVEALAFQTVRERLIHELLRLSQETERPIHESKGSDREKTGQFVALPPRTHEEWAKRIYATREQVSVVLSDLRRQGAVQYRGRSELVVSPAALVRVLEGGAADLADGSRG